jgi:PAS domain S-box-containing protein
VHIEANRPLASPETSIPAISEQQTRETLALRRAIRDLLALSTLPAAWVGRERDAIAKGVVDVLITALRVECAYLLLSSGQECTEALHGSLPDEVLGAVRARCSGDRPKAPVVEQFAAQYRAAFAPVGVASKIGVVAAISTRPDFPTEIDSMLLSVAANQAAVSLESARLLEERTRAEMALRESEVFNRTIIESSSDCIKVLALDGTLLYLSPGGERMLECTAGDLVGRYWPDFWSGADHDAAHSAIAAAKRGSIGRMQGFCPTFAGTPKWWDVVLTPIYGIDGHVERLLCTSRDMTEQRATREALIERDERLRVALQASRTGTFRWDVRTNAIWWDENLYALFGAEADSVNTIEDFTRFVHPDDLPIVHAAIAACELEGHDFEAEFRVLLPGGGTRWLLDKGKMFFDEHGCPAYMTGACTDIDERKRSDEQQRLQSKVIETIAQNATAALFMMDANRCCTYMNPAAEEMTGYTLAEIKQGEAIGLTLHDLIHHSRPDGMPFPLQECPVFQALPSGTRLIGFEGHFLRKNGTTYPVQCSACPIIENGRPVGTVMEVRDLTAQRNAEELLRNSEKLAATGRLAATIAHEINNPLESVTNLIFLAKCHPGVPDEVRQDLETADQELARVTHIAQQTLGFYRDSSRPAKIALDELIRSVLMLYQRRFEYKNLRVETKLPAAVVIDGFAGEVRQILSNLILNAVDASSNNSSIHVRLSCALPSSSHGRIVRITVADHGWGIPREHRSKIFQPFFTTKKDVGTGLGLWVTKTMVERHGGVIRFRSSTQPHRSGTVFSVLLPQTAESAKFIAA